MIRPGRRRLSQCQLAEEVKESEPMDSPPRAHRSQNQRRGPRREVPWPIAIPPYRHKETGLRRGSRKSLALESPADLYQLHQFLNLPTASSSGSEAENRQLAAQEYLS